MQQWAPLFADDLRHLLSGVHISAREQRRDDHVIMIPAKCTE